MPTPVHPERTRPLVATYRLQVRSGLDLDEVRTRWLAPLAELGVSHLYLSPVFAAASGSTHGYDVVDPGVVDGVLGGDAAFDRLTDAAHEHGLGVVVDLVPNHMATDLELNERWWDLLRRGRHSEWAGWFDLDWDAPEPRLRGRMLLPVLPDHYGRELERGAFRVERAVRGGTTELVLVHPSATTPLDPESLPLTLRGDPATIDPGVLDALNDDVEALDGLIEAQHYRPARWQTGLEDLSYRRFFDVNTLVGVRVDRADVFEPTHALVRRWIDAGRVDGLRVDHVDGLRDPAGYLDGLRGLAPDAWIVVEKILEGPERLAPWAVDGTTGYEVGELIGRLELDDEGRPALERVASQLAGSPTDVGGTVLDAKRTVLDDLLSADLNRLTEALLGICEHRRRFRDVTRRELHTCLRSVLSQLAVYRTYARPGHGTSEQDRAVIADALAAATEEIGDLDPEIVELLGVLLPGADEAIDTTDEWDFVLRFQQLSGPTMAKGAEDTAWFRLLALVSRCEVGADPDAWGLPLDEFHDAMLERQATWPLAMTSTSTHDSKRSEDVRARLALLSQDADAWALAAEEWMDVVRPSSPDPATSYQLLQTMVGAWPLDAARLGEHALKAEREAKLRTSWLRPDETFEAALAEHVDAVLTDPGAVAIVDRWVAGHDRPWRSAVLAQKLLALTVPGIPDLYQGSEELFVRLTDPDNRHPAAPPAPGGPGSSPKATLVRTALACRREHPDAFGRDGDYTALWASGPRADHAVAFTRGAGGPAVVVVTARRVLGVADGWKGTTLTLPEVASDGPAGGWLDRLGDARTTWTGTVDLDELLATSPVALLTRG